jgi:hypothetical protein
MSKHHFQKTFFLAPIGSLTVDLQAQVQTFELDEKKSRLGKCDLSFLTISFFIFVPEIVVFRRKIVQLRRKFKAFIRKFSKIK